MRGKEKAWMKARLLVGVLGGQRCFVTETRTLERVGVEWRQEREKEEVHGLVYSII